MYVNIPVPWILWGFYGDGVLLSVLWYDVKGVARIKNIYFGCPRNNAILTEKIVCKHVFFDLTPHFKQKWQKHDICMFQWALFKALVGIVKETPKRKLSRIPTIHFQGICSISGRVFFPP